MNRNEDLSEPPRLLSSFGARARTVHLHLHRVPERTDLGRRSECACAADAAADGGAAAAEAAAIREAANMDGDGC